VYIYQTKVITERQRMLAHLILLGWRISREIYEMWSAIASRSHLSSTWIRIPHTQKTNLYTHINIIYIYIYIYNFWLPKLWAKLLS